ncbi:MAG TPA: polyketide synthase dehydratase domain-containing protein [Pseudonocardiaceae bacterium]|jgi:hypothetical protein|nr:polyketide synthase dehydratase domain-containing protein [Pseudonocardiaceae bacterium]
MHGDDRIAIIGIGLSCPDATSPGELWENVLSGRAEATARPVTHAETELALDVLTAALADAGCHAGEGLPRPATSVVLGSTDTTLAEGICRHFGLGGGGLTVDTVTAPAALPVLTAVAALADRTVDVAIAGHVGVDGAGMLVLMREADALAGDRRIYALITGNDIGAVRHIDGCPAGIAGLITVVLAVHHQVLPRTADGAPALWPAAGPIKAAVPVRDTHLVIEEAAGRQRFRALPKRTVALAAGRQDAELLLLDAPDVRALRHKVADLVARVPRLAGPELTDLAGILAAELSRQPVRAAVVATDLADAHRKLGRLLDALDAGRYILFAPEDGVFLDENTGPARIAYLFPGPQGAGRGTVGVLRRRFALVDDIFRIAGPPCVVSASLAATRVLSALGIDADIATGASLGQATALAWGGALGGGDLLRLAKTDSPFDELAATTLAPLTRPIVSTALDDDPALDEAVIAAVGDADLAIEVGPWRALADLVRRIAPGTPVLSVETDSASLVPLLRAVGAAHVLGVDVDTTVLFAGRVVRPIAPEHPASGEEVPGVAPWVFTFAVDHVLVDEPPSPQRGDTASGTLAVFAPEGHPLAEPLATALVAAGMGDGVLLCLPASGADHLALIRAAAVAPGHRFVVVQHRFGATAVARARHEAEPGRPATVVDLADPTPDDPVVLALAVRRVVAEVAATTGFAEARYDAYGNRTVPRLRPLPRPAGVIMSSPLGTTDVLLVTGGGNGIVAACARELARDSGAGLVVADGDIDADLGGVTAIMYDATDGDADGLRSVLDTVAVERLKLIVTFGPPDDWAGELTIQFGQDHPRTRTVAVSCAVPLLTDDVRTRLRRILADPSAGPQLVVSGRASGLALARPPMPARARFVRRVLVHYPGIELVTETELRAETDPYLDDYEMTDGEPAFPAAMAVEAMSQVAAALTGRTGPMSLTDVEFGAPIVVPAGGSTTMRVAALVRDTETVDVVISGPTGDHHVRARLRRPRPDMAAGHQEHRFPLPAVPVDPITELYGGILRQGKRFQRLLTCRRITASRVVAEVATTAQAPWFEPSLPQDLVTADPGTRDAVLQAVQCCVPDATLVPVGVARIEPSAPLHQHTEYVLVDARERWSNGDIHHFDVDVLDPAGVVVERWEGLTVRAVRATGRSGPWVPALLGPQIERTLQRVLGGDRVVVVEPDPVPPEPYAADGVLRRADLAASRAFGHPARLRYCEDGAPWMVGTNVAVDHGAGMTMLVTGQGRLGCAIATVPDGAAVDSDAYAGLREHLMTEFGDTAAAADARVLAAVHATGEDSPVLALDRGHPDGWVALRAGDTVVATWVTNINDRPDPVVFAVSSGAVPSGEERCHG